MWIEILIRLKPLFYSINSRYAWKLLQINSNFCFYFPIIQQIVAQIAEISDVIIVF